MSQKSSRSLSKFNLVLALLWLVDVVVTAAGFLILTSSNAAQAAFYTSQSADYGTYFAAQTGSNLGATLIGVGLTGFIVTLATLVISRSIKSAAVAAPAAIDEEPEFDFDDDTDFDTDEEAAAVREHAAVATGHTTTVTAGPVPAASVPAGVVPAVAPAEADELRTAR